jgi:Kae1-associated kinase Bud32
MENSKSKILAKSAMSSNLKGRLSKEIISLEPILKEVERQGTLVPYDVLAKSAMSSNVKGRLREGNRLGVLAQAAEAIIYKKGNKIIKDRIKKSYRIPEIDNKIRKQRTKSEAKLLEKASKIINVPIPFKENKKDFQIIMPFVEGKKLSENLDSFSSTKQEQILNQIGQDISKLHDEDIIHGDLTTSNMILVENKIFFIDFGLGFISKKIEDKAVDIHLLKQALEAKHFKNWENLFKEFEKGYKKDYSESKKVLERLQAVEKRGRYKH